MLNVIVNAYAVNPNWGSEPGMGWNWIVNLSRYCNLYVITEGEWKTEIEEAVAKLPQKDNLHFYYNHVSDKVRKMCWNQGDWRFYWYYKKWQKKTFKIAQKIIATHRIDVIHQLNMIGFREPGFLWKIQGIPYVWGPIGGMELMPVAYLKEASLKRKSIVYVKNMLNRLQTRFSPRVSSALRRADALIAAVKGVADCVRKYHGREITTINETGCNPVLYEHSVEKEENEFHVLWVGKFDFRKQLGLALKVVACLKDLKGLKFHIIGTGLQKDVKKYHQLAKDLDIENICVWHGAVPHGDVQKLMRKSDIFLFTSIMEGTPHVVLESIANHLPVVCFESCGQSEAVNDKIGMKVPLSTINQSINDFSNAIRQCYENREFLRSLSENCRIRKQELSWDTKVREMLNIYQQLVNKQDV